MASNSAQFGTSIFRGGASNNNSQNSNSSGSNNNNNNNNNNNTTPQNQQLSGAQQQASHPFQSQQTTPIQQQEQLQQQQQQAGQQQGSGSSSIQVQYQPGIDNTPTDYADNRSQSPDFMATLMAKLWFDHNVESSLSSLRKEEHEKRMRDLRKQLDYINDTNWKYSPVEKFLGQH